jgi:hypothetical protein
VNRPPLEVADIVRCAGQSFIECSRKWINGQHEKMLLAITRCRTAALGGHRDQCSDCGHSAISYNSCRNRHCPKCRLVALANGKVVFRWRDSAHGNKKRIMTLAVDEFLRRFLLHLLPRGFVRIRNFGFLANRQRAMLLPLCFRLLQNAPAEISAATASPVVDHSHSLWNCPLCGGTMHVVERLSAAQLFLRLSTSTLHEPTTAASNHPRAPARTESLRLNWPTMPYQPSLQPRPVLSMPTISRCNCRALPPTATLYLSRACSTTYKTHRLARRAASFKSLYLRRPSQSSAIDYLS